MIDKTKEQMKRTRKKIVEEAPLELLENEPLVLRIFIDRSIAEVFAHDKQAIARRIYPIRGSHGQQEDFVVTTRNFEHPIMKGLPTAWMHSKDELYHSLRGPANNMTVLVTASQKKENGGSGRQEPMLMTINYGKGRVFHSVLGHTDKNSLNSVKCAGFITTLLRGAEWVVTGDVTQTISSDFPNAKAVTIWEDLEAPDTK